MNIKDYLNEELYRLSEKDLAYYPQYRFGETALQTAAWKNDISLMKYLLLFGADINKFNSQGWNALHFAAQTGQTESLNFLLENGAEYLPTSSGYYPVDIAKMHGQTEAYIFLLSATNGFKGKNLCYNGIWLERPHLKKIWKGSSIFSNKWVHNPDQQTNFDVIKALEGINKNIPSWDKVIELSKEWNKNIEDQKKVLGVKNPIDLGIKVPFNKDIDLTVFSMEDLTDTCGVSVFEISGEKIEVIDMTKIKDCERCYKRT